MATFTPKLNLEKPLGTEFYNVTGVQNVNSDKIDSFAIDIDNSKFENVGIIIPNGANLNTYRTCGHYRCPADVSAGTIINAPFGASAFSMIVEGSSGNNQAYHTQTAINHGKTQTKIRATSDAGATWTAWIHVLTEAETVNNLISTSTTQPLSANQGKQLQDTKADKTIQIVAGNGLTGGGDLTATRTINIVSNNDGIVVGSDSIELKPATSSSIGGVKIGGSMTVSADGTIDAILNQTTADGRYVNVTGDTMTGQLNGTSASFSGDVTANNAVYTNTLVLGGWTIAIV